MRDGAHGHRRAVCRPAIMVAAATAMLLALVAGRDTGVHAADPERPFKAYAVAVARDEGAAGEALIPAPTGVGEPIGGKVTATIGAGGGNLQSGDRRLTVTIPAGALAGDTEIGIEPITNLAHGGIGDGFRLTPAGQRFAAPVTFAFAYEESEIEGSSAQALGAAFQTPQGYWQWAGPPVLDPAARTVRVTSTHFSDWSAVQGFNLRPSSTAVKVAKSVALQVRYCYQDEDPGGSGVVSLGYNCDAEQAGTPSAGAITWSLRGAGTLTGAGKSAIYKAPNLIPSPNPVTVEARARWRGSGVQLLIATITVIDGGWSGEFTARKQLTGSGGTSNLTWSGTVVFAQAPGEPPGTYRIVGGRYTVRATGRTEVCFLSGTTVSRRFDTANGSSLHLTESGSYIGDIQMDAGMSIPMVAICEKSPPDWRTQDLAQLGWTIPLNGNVSAGRVMAGQSAGVNGWSYSLSEAE